MLCGRELPHFEKAEINILAEYYRPGQTFQGWGHSTKVKGQGHLNSKCCTHNLI